MPRRRGSAPAGSGGAPSRHRSASRCGGAPAGDAFNRIFWRRGPLQPVLHDIERRIISSLRARDGQDEGQIGKAAGLSPDQVRRGIQWLKLKGLARVEEEPSAAVSLGPNGAAAGEHGLPERQLLGMVGRGRVSMDGLAAKLGPAFGPAIGAARRGGWIAVGEGKGGGRAVSPARAPGAGGIPGEALIRFLGKARGPIPLGTIVADARLAADLGALEKRPGYVVRKAARSARVFLDSKAAAAAAAPAAGAIDVEADAPPAYPARTHPLTDTIEEVREAFAALGFDEISGTAVQPCFWNFDALFTPQDHPAREMQDTFYLGGGARAPGSRMASAGHVAAVGKEHERGWGPGWKKGMARRAVLRTHTTCVTVRHLAENDVEDGARLFSLGRVYRNEKASYKHLAEFNQVEGVVAGGGATLRGLMGIQKEFYEMVGMGEVKFWPTYFPYTEPSLQTMVYNKKAGKWVELFGMGILRPEVTRPLGIRGTVLAWGGGIERMAMAKHGVGDVRRFYANDVKWLRGPRCR